MEDSSYGKTKRQIGYGNDAGKIGIVCFVCGNIFTYDIYGDETDCEKKQKRHYIA